MTTSIRDPNAATRPVTPAHSTRGSHSPMTGNQAIQKAGRIGAFLARHILAVMVTVATACVLWTVTYFASQFRHER